MSANLERTQPGLIRGIVSAALAGALLLSAGCATNSSGSSSPSSSESSGGEGQGGGSQSGGSSQGSAGSSGTASPSGGTNGSSGTAGVPAPASTPGTPSSTPGAPTQSGAGSSEPALPSPSTQSGTQGGGSAGGVPQTGNDPSQSGGSASGSAHPGGAQTPDERRAAIDRRLEESLGKLDEAIRREQERTAQERDARTAATAGAYGTEDSSSDRDGDDAAAGTAETEVPGGSSEGASGPREDEGRPSRPGDLKSDRQRKAEGGGSSGGAQGSGATATEIPDGSDDDIVARRLRKAAEQETDPELKEKLWKEYIEYKKNAGK